jgi:hypothetical protein
MPSNVITPSRQPGASARRIRTSNIEDERSDDDVFEDHAVTS